MAFQSKWPQPMLMLGEHDGWMLAYVFHSSCWFWASFKLWNVRRGETDGRKKTYGLGFNGERFARGDADRLLKNEPDVHAWVVQEIRTGLAAWTSPIPGPASGLSIDGYDDA